jgi:hypothetical protein
VFGIFLNVKMPRAQLGDRRAQSWRFGGLLFAATALCGCTKFASELDALEASDTLETLPALGSSAADWSCASEASVSSPLSENLQRPLTFSLRVADFISGSPVTGLEVRACFRSDLGCTRPATAPVNDDADGVVSVPLYEGFNGYLEIRSDGMQPTMLFFADVWSAELLRLIAQVPITMLPVTMLPTSTLLEFNDGLAPPGDPTGGLVTLVTFDCNGPYAAGVRLEIDPTAVPFVFVDDLPVVNQNVTTAEGRGGFASVSPGVVVVTAYPDDGERAISVDSFLVRSGWVTMQDLIPPLAR